MIWRGRQLVLALALVLMFAALVSTTRRTDPRDFLVSVGELTLPGPIQQSGALLDGQGHVFAAIDGRWRLHLVKISSGRLVTRELPTPWSEGTLPEPDFVYLSSLLHQGLEVPAVAVHLAGPWGLPPAPGLPSVPGELPLPEDSPGREHCYAATYPGRGLDRHLAAVGRVPTTSLAGPRQVNHGAVGAAPFTIDEFSRAPTFSWLLRLTGRPAPSRRFTAITLQTRNGELQQRFRGEFAGLLRPDDSNEDYVLVMDPDESDASLYQLRLVGWRSGRFQEVWKVTSHQGYQSPGRWVNFIPDPGDFDDDGNEELAVVEPELGRITFYTAGP